MTDAIDAFIDGIKSAPQFVAAAASDPVYAQHLEAIEFGLNEIDRRANDDPEMIEAYDKAMAIISDNRRTLKQRLLALGDLLAPLRDKLRGVHH